MIESISLWADQHPGWLPTIIGLFAFIESLVLIGAMLPAIAILFSLGTAAGAAGQPLFYVLLATYIGAVLGTHLSFFMGRYFHQPLMKRKPFSTHPDWIEKGERHFARYGVMAIIFGRFVGPLRAVMPFVAGFLEMRPIKFMTIDLLTALVWSPFFLLPGYLIGANLNHPWLEPFASGGGQTAIFLFISLFSTVIFITYIARRSTRP